MSEPESSVLSKSTVIARVMEYLQDAIVELEVWRQNVRSAEERRALQRLSALLGQASAELRMNGASHDPAQQTLNFPG